MQTTVTPTRTAIVVTGNGEAARVDSSIYNAPVSVFENAEKQAYIAGITGNRGYLVYDGTSSVFYRGSLDNRRIDYGRQFSVRNTYHNYTNRSIYVVERSGLTVLLEPETRRSGEKAPCVILRKEYHFDNEATVENARSVLANGGRIQSKALADIENELMRQHSGNYGRKICVEYILLESDLLKTDKANYHHAMDVVVGFYAAGVECIHPYSAQFVPTPGLRLGGSEEFPRDLRLHVRYVSSNPNALPKYMRILNKTFAIMPETMHATKLVESSGKDAKKTDAHEYVEIMYPARYDGGAEESYRCVRLNMEEAKQFHGIFDTAAEAQNPSETYESRMRLTKDLQEFAGLEHKRQTQELRETIKDLERKLEAAKAMGAAEAERLKEKREREAHAQKMRAESFKLGSAVLLTVLGLIPLIIKIRQATNA